jgi:L-aspartate oxidase
MHADVLVIGTGIAGLSFAVRLANRCPDKKIVMISKRDLLESNTKYAQGGIAVVSNFSNDSYSNHVQDTLRASDYTSDSKVVDFVVREGPLRVKELMDWGADFDKKGTSLHLGKEGGHSAKRIVHHKDQSGLHIQNALIEKASAHKNIHFFENYSLVDLITDHHLQDKKYRRCYGAYVISIKDEQIIKITSQLTVLSTGGAGQVYAHTTNPNAATGDGLGAAYRAKVHVKNLHFVQFHPTALYPKVDGNTFLISEAIRGAGAILRNEKGEAFMHKYDAQLDLAPRDVVSRAINAEMKKYNTPHVYLDATNIDPIKLEQEFPTIKSTCMKLGINISKTFIPVLPAAHYFCGGIDVDENGQSSLSALYAIGECSHTGLHGANRLASNSLLEALVFAARAAEQAAETLQENILPLTFFDTIPDWLGAEDVSNERIAQISLLRSDLQHIMSAHVGIIKSGYSLHHAEIALQDVYASTALLYQKNKLTPQLTTLRNLVSVAYLIIKQSQQHSENKGVYYNQDYV